MVMTIDQKLGSFNVLVGKARIYFEVRGSSATHAFRDERWYQRELFSPVAETSKIGWKFGNTSSRRIHDTLVA